MRDERLEDVQSSLAEISRKPKTVSELRFDGHIFKMIVIKTSALHRNYVPPFYSVKFTKNIYDVIRLKKLSLHVCLVTWPNKNYVAPLIN